MITSENGSLVEKASTLQMPNCLSPWGRGQVVDRMILFKKVQSLNPLEQSLKVYLKAFLSLTLTVP